MQLKFELQQNLPERTVREVDTLRRADKALVTDCKSNTCNISATSKKRPPLTSKLWTATTTLGPKAFRQRIFTPNSGHTGNTTFIVQPRPSIVRLFHTHAHASAMQLVQSNKVVLQSKTSKERPLLVQNTGKHKVSQRLYLALVGWS